ncbi:MAG: HEAT repeat protein [Acidimicrobiales bacterium]
MKLCGLVQGVTASDEAAVTSIPRLVADNHLSSSSLPSDMSVQLVIEAGHLGDRPTAHRALTSEAPEIRAVALSACLRLKTLDWLLLEPFFDDPSPFVRRRALELAVRLEPIGAPLSRLLARLVDTAAVAEMGAFALGEIGRATPEVVDALAQMTKNHDDPLCREAAVAALGALHSGRETILGALADIATVRRRAVLALAPFDGPDIEAALTHALTDRDWQVRQAAEDLLG